jgi:hypothetical protein
MRLTSTTPLQALYLLNDKFVHEQAIGFASRLLGATSDDSSRIEKAWMLLFSRPPNEEEVNQAHAFLESTRDALRNMEPPTENVEQQCWQSFARALLRLNEVAYVD